ncbi:MAG TPA: hypothetical protein VMY43_08080 [Methanothrix sp.]|jgi:hypothetical protein|nr:hypothetical protein [Methanothrix sp.]
MEFDSILKAVSKEFNAFVALADLSERQSWWTMTEQNRNYIKKEVGKLLSEIWRIKGLSEQEYGPNHLITKKLASMHGDAQALLQEK